jgi:hypothetical protein
VRPALLQPEIGSGAAFTKEGLTTPTELRADYSQDLDIPSAKIAARCARRAAANVYRGGISRQLRERPMIQFNDYARNAKAPKLFVNEIGGIHRLEGGIIEVTLIKRFEQPTRWNPIEQVTLIWPEASWFNYAHTLEWVTKEITRGTFRGDVPAALKPN